MEESSICPNLKEKSVFCWFWRISQWFWVVWKMKNKKCQNLKKTMKNQFWSFEIEAQPGWSIMKTTPFLIREKRFHLFAPLFSADFKNLSFFLFSLFKLPLVWLPKKKNFYRNSELTIWDLSGVSLSVSLIYYSDSKTPQSSQKKDSGT